MPLDSLASELKCSTDMKRISRKKHRTRLLRWVFQLNNRLLTCQLEVEGQEPSYTLSLVPHWDVRQAASARFDAGIRAFQRHAAIADQLRRQGWTVAAYSVVR
jgi:hypothetical protein